MAGRPHLEWELIACAWKGHALVGDDAARLGPEDVVFAREDAHGTRWHRCLRCDSWVALPRPSDPRRERPPAREQISLPLRGRALRDRLMLRLIALDRAFHWLVLWALAAAVLVFSADRATLRQPFYKAIADLQGGTVAGESHARHGLLHELDTLFTTSSSHLHLLAAVLLAYGTVEGIEALGLWRQRRWAEYLTFLVTTSLLPFEVYEIANRTTVLKVIAFVVNVAVVVYLLLAKRLFGLRGGAAANEAERGRDQGWEALERSAPAAPAAARPSMPAR